MAKLEFTVTIYGPESECKKVAKRIQSRAEQVYANANPAKPVTTMLIGENKVDGADAST